MFILPKVIYRLNVISIKIPTVFFTEIGKTILKFMWNTKYPQITGTLSKKSKAGCITFSDFKYIIKL